MNHLALQQFDKDDRQHFAQLIGYSVDGYADLSYKDKAVLADADEESEGIRRFNEYGLTKYTVHLLYPDYMVEASEHSTLLTSAWAPDPRAAFAEAVKEVESTYPGELKMVSDLHVLGIYAGAVEDLNPFRDGNQ